MVYLASLRAFPLVAVRLWSLSLGGDVPCDDEHGGEQEGEQEGDGGPDAFGPDAADEDLLEHDVPNEGVGVVAVGVEEPFFEGPDETGVSHPERRLLEAGLVGQSAPLH